MKFRNFSKFRIGCGKCVSVVAVCFVVFIFLNKQTTLDFTHQGTKSHCSGANSNSEKCQNVPFYESLSVLLVTKQPFFTGCVNRNDPRIKKVPSTTQLKFEPIDCALFCVGRNYSRVNIRTDGMQSTCFCSGDLPSLESTCENSDTIFKSYSLDPVSFPSLKVNY